MRHKRLLIMLFIQSCITFAMSAVNGYHDVTLEEALEEVLKYSHPDIANVYRTANDYPDKWVLFIDMTPDRGWPHSSYIYEIPKTVPDGTALRTRTKQISMSYPPSEEFVPCLFNQPNSSFRNVKPKLRIPGASNTPNPLGSRTYALIISGGVNPISNYERYWNDCSFIYQTLVKRYDIPKENIYPIMSDGTNPGADMNLTTGGFASQSLDLDFDGENEIKLAATKANIQSTLNSLANKLQKDDHLFIYVIDHGGTNDYNTNSYICLWGQESLYDYELANMLTPFTSKLVNVNVVLGQCFSGGFIDNLTKTGCVVAAASKGSESSWACSSIPYDEFVYHWTCAVNGADHLGQAIKADTDNNGRVTMDEAFLYAKNNDRANEQPQYVSTPRSVGEDLAFNHLAPSIDLYLKDNPEDTGKEPNMTTDKFWISPSIWIRNKADGIYEHENPYYSEDHQAATIYVRVYNRGKENYTKGKYYIHTYWAKASTGFQPYTWTGNEVYAPNAELTGGPLQARPVPSIAAGEYTDINIPWSLPVGFFDETEDNDPNDHHYCILAQITDTPRETWYDGKLSYACKSSNKDAQKNISIIDKTKLKDGTKVFVRNVTDDTKKYTLSIVPRTKSDESIFTAAKIQMDMSQPIYEAWERGGFRCNNINRTPTTEPKTVQFISKDSKIEAISLEGREFDKVSLKFNFRFMPAVENYTVDLIQRDESGEIIGGETFIVEAPRLQINPVEITPIPREDGKVILSTNADEDSYVRWENAEGMTISESNTVIVSPDAMSDNTYHAYVTSKDGAFASEAITLEPTIGFDKVYTDNLCDNLFIDLKCDASEYSLVTIAPASNINAVISQNLKDGDRSITLDISSLSKGVYVVSHIVNGVTVDSTKFVKR